MLRFSRALIPLLAAVLLAPVAYAAQHRPLDVTVYVIHATLDPAAHTLSATADVTFTANDDLTTAAFDLNRSLSVTSVTLAADPTHPLDATRSASGAIQVTLPAPMAHGLQATLTFTYSGTLNGADSSPIEGVRTAAISDPISVLLYPGQWFPSTPGGYLISRFTSELHLTVPAGETVIASGPTGAPHANPDNTQTFDFNWPTPGFPGSVIAGKFAPTIAPAGTSVRIVATDARAHDSTRNLPEYAAVAERQFDFLTSLYGPPSANRLTLVELPEDSVSAFWAPQIVAINGARLGFANSHRLLSNTIARQWWSNDVSPASLSDAWITNGLSRYSELLTLEDESGAQALHSAVNDVAAGALAYDTQPLSSIGRADVFSPTFQSMTLEKGAMVFHMLRWQLGDQTFHALLKGLYAQFHGATAGISRRDVETAANALSANATAETGSAPELTAFFSQWIDSNGAPSYTNQYTVYRLGGNKGFRIVGSLSEDLDLFSMPVLLKIETEGRTVTQRLQVAGTQTAYNVETYGRPRRISLDPDGWLLRQTPELGVRVAILRGQQRMAEGDPSAAIAEYRKALAASPNSSLASYRIGEALFQQRSYQSAADAFRDALRGDSDPRWTEVWSHIMLGKIFDVTGQRTRAVNEYRLAVQTNDNTQGALNEARKYLSTPYQQENPT